MISLFVHLFSAAVSDTFSFSTLLGVSWGIMQPDTCRWQCSICFVVFFAMSSDCREIINICLLLGHSVWGHIGAEL